MREENWDSSRHWRQSERLPGGVAVRSFHVRRVLIAADYRRRHPTLWERLQAAVRQYAWRHRLTAARIVN